MIYPEFGSIFSKYCKGANTPDGAISAMQLALTEFWRLFQEYYSIGKFNFTGAAITGPTTVTMAGVLGSFNSATQLNVPNTSYIKSVLHGGGDPFVNLFKLFSYTLNMSIWQIDCKAAGFMTPYVATIKTDFTAQAAEFKTKMYSLAPTTHEEAMDILSAGVKDCLQTVIAVVPYLGTAGATTLTGTMTIQFGL